MRKKVGILAVFMIFLVIPSLVNANPFYYISGSKVEDKITADQSFIIIEGYYFLVLDNTGHFTGNLSRIDSIVYYQLTFDVNNSEPILGQDAVPAEEYFILPFNFELPEVYIAEANLIIHASEMVSAFITNYIGLTQYLEELGKIDIVKQKRILTTVISIASTLIVLLFGTIIVIQYRIVWNIQRRIRAYRNKKAGRRFKNIG